MKIKHKIQKHRKITSQEANENETRNTKIWKKNITGDI